MIEFGPADPVKVLHARAGRVLARRVAIAEGETDPDEVDEFWVLQKANKRAREVLGSSWPTGDAGSDQLLIDAYTVELVKMVAEAEGLGDPEDLLIIDQQALRTAKGLITQEELATFKNLEGA